MKRIGIIGLIGLLVASGCTVRSHEDLTQARTGAAVRATPASLLAFDGCEPLLDELQELGETQAARDLAGDAVAIGPMDGPGFARDNAMPRASTTTVDDAEAATAPSAASDGAEWGGTNVQEAGVDEPDIIKTDGNLVLTLGGGRLRIVDMATGTPTQLSELPAPLDAQLLVDGATALVLSGGIDGMSTDLTAIDISTPGAPAVREQLRVDGWLTNARMVDGMVRVVTTTGTPRIAFDQATPSRAAETARRNNLDAVRASQIGDWLPRVQSVSADGRVVEEQPAVECDDVFVPEAPAITSMVNVVSVDLRTGDLEAVDGASVVGVGDTVYASADHLYVTSSGWASGSGTGDVTDVHQFAIAGREPASYLASGRVGGWLLNQFSLSEHAGDLRVAVTGAGPDGTESSVVVLRSSGEELVEAGRVDGLGRGEQIRSVRFLGDVGYVVTFRQTDPLYTIDLSDPASPRMVGELKIPGYSSYLHPAGDGALIGIGQDATLQGQLLGLQVALFDVADLAAPQQRHKYVLEGATSAAETEHHALLWWAETGLLLLPVTDWDEGGGFEGAIAFSVSDDGIREQGRLQHAGAPIERFLALGDQLLSVSAAGIGVTDPNALTETTFVAFD